MELGSWSLIQAPSLLALIPLIIAIILMFREMNTSTALTIGVIIGALMLGQNLGSIAAAYKTALGSSTAFIGVIIMVGAGLGVLMTETGVTQTLVYWIVKRIGVNTRTKAKVSLVVCSILICGLLGTLGGGNAVISPIILPIMATLGITPSVVATLFKTAGEIGLILGPLTGVTLITMEVTGLTYGQLMIQACIPFAAFWLAGAWIGCNRLQKLTEGKESYELTEDMKHLDNIVLTPKQIRTTVVFLISFVALVVYGILSKQGTNYALVVMICLCVILTIASWMNADKAMKCVAKGMASQANMFATFITIQVLLNYVELGGGFEALSEILGGIAQGGGATGVMLIASLVGGFGIEASAVAEIQIITDMFKDLAVQTGLPMGCFAVSILAATRLTGSMYPASNLAGQLGTAQCENLGGVLRTLWISAAFGWGFVVLYSFVGPMILG